MTALTYLVHFFVYEMIILVCFAVVFETLAGLSDSLGRGHARGRREGCRLDPHPDLVVRPVPGSRTTRPGGESSKKRVSSRPSEVLSRRRASTCLRTGSRQAVQAPALERLAI